ncbi:unnamed protein product [Pleuronectes platessa]|uniref:Bromodomain protein 4 C-terminal domain-containing protein n=1 Tax=Pleuronectes platessa TaxID=8262 RepID=A0A9N7VGU7_PLEPL|nr:unnamed protein product [Pleuronectes platessa]
MQSLQAQARQQQQQQQQQPAQTSLLQSVQGQSQLSSQATLPPPQLPVQSQAPPAPSHQPPPQQMPLHQARHMQHSQQQQQQQSYQQGAGLAAQSLGSQHKVSISTNKAQQIIQQQQDLSSPRPTKADPYTGHMRDNPSPLMMHSPQLPQYPPVSHPSPPHNVQPKKQRAPGSQGGLKEEKLAPSPVMRGESFNPAMRPDHHKHPDNKPSQPGHGQQNVKSMDSSRPVIRSSEPSGPPPALQDKEKFKQESKAPVAPKKVQDVKLKNMGSWASLAQKSTSTPMSAVKSSSDSFEQFRRAAREKEEREKALKAQAEQAEKDRLRREQDKLRGRDEDDVMETTRRVHEEPRRRQEQQHIQAAAQQQQQLQQQQQHNSSNSSSNNNNSSSSNNNSSSSSSNNSSSSNSSRSPRRPPFSSLLNPPHRLSPPHRTRSTNRGSLHAAASRRGGGEKRWQRLLT